MYEAESDGQNVISSTNLVFVFSAMHVGVSKQLYARLTSHGSPHVKATENAVAA
jgi:hypothetical protein